MSDDPTTDPAAGAEQAAVDRRSHPPNPRTRAAEPTIHNRGERL